MDQDHDGIAGEIDDDSSITKLFSQDISIASTNMDYDDWGIVIHSYTATIDGAHNYKSFSLYGGAVVNHTSESTEGDGNVEI